jgi:formate hydrogenlyase transcriptional activator
VDESPGGWVWKTQQPFIVSDVDEEARFSRVIEAVRQSGVKSFCILPLTSANRRLGALGFASLRYSAYGEDDLEFLQQVTNQVAVAIDNAINFESARKSERELKLRLEQLGLLLEVNNSIVSQLDLRELFKMIADCLRGVIDYDGAAMTLYDPESGQLRVYALERRFAQKALLEEDELYPIEETPGAFVFHSRCAALITRADLENSTSMLVRRAVAEGVKSGCIAPMISHGKVLGTLDLASLREDAFTEKDAELLTQIASQVAIAVENALNFDSARRAEQEVARERDRWRRLLEINNAIVSHLDLSDLIKAVSDTLQEAMSHDFIGITLYDAENNCLRPFAYTGDIRERLNFIEEGMPVPLAGTPLGHVFTSGQPLLIKKPDPERFHSDLAKRLISQGVRSGCAVPLVVHGRKIGVFGIGSFEEEAFTEDDLDFLTRIAGQTALAVENALNFGSARRAERQVALDRDRFRLLLEVNNAIVSHLDLHDLLKAISSSLLEVVTHDMVGITLYDEETRRLRPYAYSKDFPETANLMEGAPVTIEGSPVGLVFTSGRPLVTQSPDPEKFPSGFAQHLGEKGAKSGCGIPLIAHGRKLGVFSIGSFKEAAFVEEDLDLLTQIAGQIAVAVENALAYREIESLKNKLNEEKLYLEEEISATYDFEQIIGSSAALMKILKQVETVAPTDSTVLIQGETGTGKELIARAIHNVSLRRQRTMVKLNCAAIPTGLLESELFGHEKGAFTGAIDRRIGRFELADKGTLFLDEVGEIPVELQPKLLRVLQEQEFERLGSARTLRVDARLIAATNRDLEQMVAERRFRDDLYYRLKVFPITVPPLRERPEDIPALVRFFAGKFARRMNKRIEAISSEGVAALQEYTWPGNIRELENFIERAVILTEGAELRMPMSEIKLSAKPAARQAAVAEPLTSTEGTLEAIEREHILKALDETNWVIGGASGAASKLGLKRTTLQARMKKLGITRQN